MSSTHRLRSVEGARGVAALSVLGFHVATHGHTAVISGPAGYLWLGVPLFFLLSGFLLFRPFARAIIHGGPRSSFRRYGRARFLRIVPAYWLALTVAAAIQTHPLSFWHGVVNYLLIYTLFHLRGVMAQAWTLCIEIAFYAVLPVFALAVAWLSRRMVDPKERALLIVAALLPAFPISYVWLDHAGNGPGQLPVWLPGYLDEFAIGMLLAVSLEIWPQISARTSRTLMLLAAVVSFAAMKIQRFGDPVSYTNGTSILFPRLVEFAFALVLLSVLARDGRTMLGRVLSSRLLVAAGSISYGVYLWHQLVIDQLGTTSLWTGAWVGLALTIPVTIALAIVSWFGLERPLLRLKDSKRSDDDTRRGLGWIRRPVTLSPSGDGATNSP